jgi:hypothetical protein
LPHFFARGPAFFGCILFRWVRASAPAGCSPRGLGGVVLLLRGLSALRNTLAGLVVLSCELAIARVHGRVPSSRAGMLTLSTVWPEPGLREQPPSLCTGREDGQGQTRLFYIRPCLAFPQGGGGKAPCCPRVASNMVSPMSCWRVIRADVRAPFVRGRLEAQRRAQKYMRVICRTRSPCRWGPRARCLPLMGFRYKIVPAGLGNVLGYLGSVARASVMYRTYPGSSLALCLRRL